MQTKTKEEKQELLQLYRQSGMSVRAFAEEFEQKLALQETFKKHTGR